MDRRVSFVEWSKNGVQLSVHGRKEMKSVSLLQEISSRDGFETEFGDFCYV